MASPGQVDIAVESAEGLKRQITVRVPNTEIDREVDLRLKQMGKTARLKGFRPGKVPPKVVRNRYGGQVRQEVLGEIIRSSFSHAVTEKQMNPAGGPSIEPLAETATSPPLPDPVRSVDMSSPLPKLAEAPATIEPA